MYIDTDYYSKENLREKDRTIIEEIERFSASVFNDDVVDDFIENKYDGDIPLSDAREVVQMFVSEMQRLCEEISASMIVSFVESYEEEANDSKK